MPDSPYTFRSPAGRPVRARVRAVNAAGAGAWAESNVVIPDGRGASDPFAVVARREATTPRELIWGRWHDWEFGGDTPWEIRSVEGLATMPNLRTGDTDRSQQPGMWPGQDWDAGRVVTVGLRAIGCERAPDLVDEIVYATPSEREEGELLINGRWTIFCRPRRREVPQLERFAPVVNATVQWEAADPRIYEAEQSADAFLANYQEAGRIYEDRPSGAPPLPTGPPPTGWWNAALGSGLAREYLMPGDSTADPPAQPRFGWLGWQYPGEDRAGGLMIADNHGRRESWRIRGRIVGPCLNPQLVHVQRQERVELGVELLAGQAIDLDWWLGTITMEDQSRYLTLSSRSRWWPLDPGLNTIRFLAARFDAGARCYLWWRSAW